MKGDTLTVQLVNIDIKSMVHLTPDTRMFLCEGKRTANSAFLWILRFLPLSEHQAALCY